MASLSMVRCARVGISTLGWTARIRKVAAEPGWLDGSFICPWRGSLPWLRVRNPEQPPLARAGSRREFVSYGDDAELEEALADLDQLENVEGGLFVRRVLPVILDSGIRFGAWVHLFETDRLLQLEKDAVELPQGDWAPYLDPTLE